MRVVVDTNVWISGLISPAGSPARVVQAVMDGQIIPVFSKATFAELRSVLVRPKISRFLTRSSVEVKAFLGNLETIAEFVEAPRGTSAIRDAKDRPFLDLAASRPAPDFLVTGDRDFDRSHYEGVAVITPSRFAALMRSDGTFRSR